jgi:thaumarchaeosortase
LELILGWEDLKPKTIRLRSAGTAALAITMILPTLYVAWSYLWGLNDFIKNWATQTGIQWATTMPLSIEYVNFAAVFVVICLLAFGSKGLKAFAIPAFFLALVGTLYIIDNVFPYGQFTPFQVFVPTATALAAFVLNLMGYTTIIGTETSSLQGTMPLLSATNPHTAATAAFTIAWPCAGVESFLIFTVVALLFLKRMPISLKAKAGFFIFGVAITYLINALRIVNIFLIGMQYGAVSPQVDTFHLYYGPMYAIAWIVMYPLIILAALNLWRRTRKTKPATEPLRL